MVMVVSAFFSQSRTRAALAGGRNMKNCLLWYLLSPLGAGAAHASSYLALAIAVASWNVLG
jgi:hypothetical protein